MIRIIKIIVLTIFSIFSIFILFNIDNRVYSIEEYTPKNEVKVEEKEKLIEKEIVVEQKEMTNAKTTEKKETKVVTPKKSTTNNKKVTKQNNTKKIDIITKIKNDKGKIGTYGRLYVSTYSAALYDYNVNTKSKISLQTIVNNKDSAAYYINFNRYVIADHNYQGFKILTKIKKGSKAYIKLNDGKILTYKLISVSTGTNTGKDLIDSKGNSFYDMESGLIMYTCYKNGIVGTLWKKV